MGKEYFEFLEEEYMGLTSQVQQGLKQQQVVAQKDGPNTAIDVVDLPLLFTRCQAIYQQMQVESRKTPEFKERLTLYSIQLSTLLEHYQSSLFPPTTVAPSSTTATTATANNTNEKKTTKASVKSTDAVSASAVPAPTKAAASTLRQELTFTFTINEEDDYDTSLK